MKRRFKMKGRKARKLFRKTAGWTHKRNIPRVIPRGGIRL